MLTIIKISIFNLIWKLTACNFIIMPVHDPVTGETLQVVKWSCPVERTKP